MLKHGIRSAEVREALTNGVRIEEYPDDTPFPSYLVLGSANARVPHIVASEDPLRNETIVITTYEPDPGDWESDHKTRKRP